jgi:MFS family permease
MAPPKYTPLKTHVASGASEMEPLHVEASPREDDEEQSAPSVCFMICLNLFGFAYSLVVCTLGVVILPSEAIRLFSDQHAMMLGIMLGCTGVSQLIGPAVGYQSDRSTSRYGRRRPLMALGAVVACAGFAAMLFARVEQLPYMYMAALATASCGLNIRCVLRGCQRWSER